MKAISYVNTNEIERDRWENHSPEHQRITPFANPSDWTWEWSMGQTYYILDEESNVLDEGTSLTRLQVTFLMNSNVVVTKSKQLAIDLRTIQLVKNNRQQR